MEVTILDRFKAGESVAFVASQTSGGDLDLLAAVPLTERASEVSIGRVAS